MHFGLHFRYALTAAGLVAAGFATLPASAQFAVLPEDQAIAALQAEGDYLAHMAAFRSLHQNGTEKAIPVVAGFLHDVQKSHLARYALEEMPFPEASAALRKALDGAPAEVVPGIIASLGARRDAEAVPQLKALLTSSHADTAQAAAGALGRIASADAVAVLQEAYAAAPDEAHKVRLAEGLLAAAEQHVKDGDKAGATTIYRALRKKGNPDFVRVAAFNGLALSLPEKTPQRVLRNLQGPDPLYRNLAREVVADTDGAEATKAYVDALPTLPADAQAALLDGLGRRGDKSARDGAAAALASDSPEVQAAAAIALGLLGGEQDVERLAPLLVAQNDAVATAARNSLIRLQGDGINPHIVKTLGAADAPVKAKLLNLLDVRIAPEAVPQATAHLNDQTTEVRLAALDVLLQNGSVAELPALLAVLKGEPEQAERALAARSFGAIAGRSGDAALPIILENIDSAAPSVKTALVEALGKIGGAQALTPVIALLDSSDEALKKTALSVLTEWPTADATGKLLELAQSQDATLHDAGLKGYTRLARVAGDGAMLAQAMGLAKTKEEKWAILSAYGTVQKGESLDALAAHLDDPEVQREAAAAILAVAEPVSKQGEEGKAKAKATLELLKTKVSTEYVQKRAGELIAKMG